ncbi:hypothetical protein KGP36_07090 [Patescibacteria group bacterium]|nr:hypothetical protein [Patescibacteria group bacterium]
MTNEDIRLIRVKLQKMRSIADDIEELIAHSDDLVSLPDQSVRQLMQAKYMVNGIIPGLPTFNRILNLGSHVFKGKIPGSDAYSTFGDLPLHIVGGVSDSKLLEIRHIGRKSLDFLRKAIRQQHNPKGNIQQEVK